MQRDRTDIQYVRYYYDGNAARQAELHPPKHRILPRVEFIFFQKPVTVIRLDPLALAALALALVMSVVLVLGLAELGHARAEQQQMREYLWEVEDRNEALQEAFSDEYNLREVREQALAMGMVPQEALQHIDLPVQVVELPAEASLWERARDFLLGLFA
ncbi:MAG TPA: hypothetical protein IAC31_04255 [Candidatus Faecousia intestinigallinarum]|nr:hypothetical protein [Candidatus Faecousia intestinigallinarum]